MPSSAQSEELGVSVTEWVSRNKWFGILESFAFLGLFIWLRWFSSLWQYRWTGFLFGIVFVSSSLRNPNRLRPWRDRISLYASPKIAWFATIICPLALGGLVMKHFFAGPAFFSFNGPKAGSDDGFFGIVILASAIDGAYSFWLSSHDSDIDKDNSLKTQTHGQ